MRLLVLLSFAAAAIAQTTGPRVISKQEAEYTEEARKAGVNAEVVVAVVVGDDGVPRDVRLLRPAGFGLDEHAMDEVRKWRFEPGTRNGHPIAVPAQIAVSFRLRERNRDRQMDRLYFELPAGGERPELIRGRMPQDPRKPGDARVRVALTISAEGVPKDINVLESSPPEWGEEVAREVNGWRFRPGAIGRQPAEIKGTFEITAGRPPVGSAPPTQPRPATPLVSILPSEPTDPSLPAPRLVSPEDGATFSIFPRATACRWEASAGAVAYVLEWDYKYSGKWHAEDQKAGAGYLVKGTEFTFDFVGGQPGRWRVWPVNSAGTRGMPSEWRTFLYTR